MSEILTNHKPDKVTFQSCKLVLTEQMTMIYHQHLQIFSLIQIFLLRQIFPPNQTETRKYILETVKSVKCLIIVTLEAMENSGQFCHTTQYSFYYFRFNSEIDYMTGYKTKTMMCSPIKDQHGAVIGVAQVKNKIKALNIYFFTYFFRNIMVKL